MAIDSLRGALLVMMAINHVPADVHVLTDQPLGFVSSAEGFVFLAGLVSGHVYTRRGKSTSELVRLGASRALKLYGVHLATLLAAFAWIWLYHAWTGDRPNGSPILLYERPLATLAAGAALLYQPGLLDILPLYCGMMLALPHLLLAFERGRAPLVFLLSLTWWSLTNLFDAPRAYVSGVIDTGSFNFGAWQLLFLTGAWFGHAWAHGRALIPRLRVPLVSLAVGVALWLCLARHGLLETPLTVTATDPLTNKGSLGPVRLANVALLFGLFALAVERFPRAFQVSALALIGRESLAAFATHIVVAMMVIGVPSVFQQTSWGRWLGPLLVIGSMLLAAAIATGRGARRKRSLTLRSAPRVVSTSATPNADAAKTGPLSAV